MICDPNILAQSSSCLRCLTDAQLIFVRTYLMCQWAQRASTAPSNLDITVPSTAANIVLTWTNPTPAATTNEVWRSSDGITFALLTTVSGGVATATDASGLAAGSFFYYKVRSCKGTTCSDFSPTISACNTYVSPNVATISFPTLIRAFGAGTSFMADTLAALTSVSLPALKRVDAHLDLANNPLLTSVTLTALQVVGGSLFLGSNNITGALSLPALISTVADLQTQSNPLISSISAPNMTSCGNILQIGMLNSLTSVNFPLLQTVGSSLFFELDPLLTTISFPALVSVGGLVGDQCNLLTSASLPLLTTATGGINWGSCPALTTVTFPNLLFTNGTVITFTADALNVATINKILSRGVASSVTTCNFQLAGGTNAPPNLQGVADKTTLIGQGNTVNTN